MTNAQNATVQVTLNGKAGRRMIPSQKTEAMCCAQVFGGENGDADGNLLSFYAGISHFLRGSFFIPVRKTVFSEMTFHPWRDFLYI